MTAFLDGSVSFHSDPAVRRALRPLANLAAERRCAILMVRHLTKQPGQRALYRGLGSIAVVASCRIGWLAVADPNLPGRHVLSVQKTNFTAPAHSLAYSLGGMECTHLAPRDEFISRSETSPLNAPLAWLGPAAVSAVDLLAPRTGPRQRARRLLADLLKDGPRTSAELRAAIAPLNVKWRTLHRAADDLDVDLRKIGNQFVGQTT